MKPLNPLYMSNYSYLISTYRDSCGFMIPRSFRKPLFDYLSKGEIPTGLLYGILTKNFNKLFLKENTKLERSRVHTVVEFLIENVQATLWGSHNRLVNHKLMIETGTLRNIQLKFHKDTYGVSKFEVD